MLHLQNSQIHLILTQRVLLFVIDSSFFYSLYYNLVSCSNVTGEWSLFNFYNCKNYFKMLINRKAFLFWCLISYKKFFFKTLINNIRNEICRNHSHFIAVFYSLVLWVCTTFSVCFLGATLWFVAAHISLAW